MENSSKKKILNKKIDIIARLLFLVAIVIFIWYPKEIRYNLIMNKSLLTYCILQIIGLWSKIKILDTKIEFMKVDLIYRLQQKKKEKTS
jgi:hypothetical protein